MKVRYHIEKTMFYTGVTDIPDDEYHKMKGMDDDKLGEALFDGYVDRETPDIWYIESVDDFQRIAER